MNTRIVISFALLSLSAAQHLTKLCFSDLPCELKMQVLEFVCCDPISNFKLSVAHVCWEWAELYWTVTAAEREADKFLTRAIEDFFDGIEELRDICSVDGNVERWLEEYERGVESLNARLGERIGFGAHKLGYARQNLSGYFKLAALRLLPRYDARFCKVGVVIEQIVVSLRRDLDIAVVLSEYETFKGPLSRNKPLLAERLHVMEHYLSIACWTDRPGRLYILRPFMKGPLLS